MMALGKLSKCNVGFPGLKLKLRRIGMMHVENYRTYSPPNNCIPKRVRMKMKRLSSKIKLMILRMELNNENTRFLNDDQYLRQPSLYEYLSTRHYLVNFNNRNSLMHRKAEKPKDRFGLII